MRILCATIFKFIFEIYFEFFVMRITRYIFTSGLTDHDYLKHVPGEFLGQTRVD